MNSRQNAHSLANVLPTIPYGLPKQVFEWVPFARRWMAGEMGVRSEPVSRVLSWATIYLEPASPLASSRQPGCAPGQRMASLFALAPDGVCQAAALLRRWCALTAPFQLFSDALPHLGVFFSVALSVGSPRPAVSWHPALWSPDFPHRMQACSAVAWLAPRRRW